MTHHHHQSNADAVAQLDRLIGKQQARISDANTKIDALKRERAALTRPLEPQGNRVDAVTLGFKKTFPGTPRIYHYAAIRAPGGMARPWAVTQTMTHSRVPAMSWGELLDFIGETNWPSIEVMVSAPPQITVNLAESTHDRLQRLQAVSFANGRL